MAFYKKNISNNDNTEAEKVSQPVINNYEQEPVQVASIVINSIQQGNYSEIGQKLEELPSTGSRRTQYVFEAPKTTLFKWIIGICICFILGYLYFAVMGFGMHIYSENYEEYSLIFLGSTLVIFVINITLIILAVNSINFAKRYEKYFELMRYKNVEIIDDICACTTFPYSKVVKDLSCAVKQKLIPQGHFSTENLVFIASNELFEKYEENKPAYDRYYRKLIEERIRMGERTEEIQKILDIGQEYIDKIHDSNRLIKEKEITLKLNQMEKIVATIFREVDLNPGQSGKLGMFLNYYLPTTEKLLNAYIDINEKEIEGTSIKNSKRDIEHAIDMLIISFEGILNQFYEKQELDIASDISAMEQIISQEQV